MNKHGLPLGPLLAIGLGACAPNGGSDVVGDAGVEQDATTPRQVHEPVIAGPSVPLLGPMVLTACRRNLFQQGPGTPAGPTGQLPGTPASMPTGDTGAESD